MLRRGIAILVTGGLYSGAALFSRLMRWLHGAPCGGAIDSIMVIGTFHNPNWFHAHITPLTMSGLEKVYLVCDEPVAALDGLVYLCPPRLLQRILSRAGAKFVWALICGLRYRPGLYMGYHIIPAGVTALVLARIFGRPASYQVTSGQLELNGGGYGAENPYLAALGGPSRLIEQLAHMIVGEFDSVIVRGDSSLSYIRELAPHACLDVVTGSVMTSRIPDANDRDIDVIFVGRLSECKQPDVFIEIIDLVRKRHPAVKACLLGDGPMAVEVQQLIAEHGLEGNIVMAGKVAQVFDYLVRAKVFAITSRSEGLSIAMMEAMCAGVVPVVFDVGDLSDLVEHGRNGFLVARDDVTTFASAIERCLEDPAYWAELSQHARRDARECCDAEVIASRWSTHFSRLADMATSCAAQ